MYKLQYRCNKGAEWVAIGVAHVDTYTEAKLIAAQKLRIHLRSKVVTLTKIDRYISAVWVADKFIGMVKMRKATGKKR